MWALQKNLKNENDFFFKANGQLSNLKKIEIVNIIGSYSPFEEVLHKALRLQVEPSISKVFEGFKRYYLQCLKANKFLVLLIDEFGKLLEYAAQNNPEERIFFIQQFAELVNNPDHKILLINTLHQNFNAYSSGLNSEQKQEWNKVRGRFVELTFNEPIEQLLFLAAHQIKQWNIFGIESLFDTHKNDIILNSGFLPISNEFAKK